MELRILRGEARQKVGSQPWTSGKTPLVCSGQNLLGRIPWHRVQPGNEERYKRTGLGELKTDLFAFAGIYIVRNLHVKIAREEMIS